MSRQLTVLTAAVLTASALAGPALAGTSYLAYDPADRITTALTRGLTLEVHRGLFGAVAIRRIISTTTRGSADIRRGGPDEARRALPEYAGETTIYTIPEDGDGRPLARALCPGAEQTYLVVGMVRAVRPLTMHAVGRWADGQYRHCVELSYTYRGEWALPPRSGFGGGDSPLPERP